MVCDRCGIEMIAAESMINDKYYCHTFSNCYPTCYMLETWGIDKNPLPSYN